MLKNNIKPDFSILDGIRGIAAIYVVINHCRGHLLIGGSELTQQQPFNNWSIYKKIYYGLLQTTSLGSEFVIVFFVLSGFSIAFSVKNQNNWSMFYLKRFVRLYPPYIFALIWAGFTYYVISQTLPVLNNGKYSVYSDFSTIMKNLFYLRSGNYIAQFWSLIFEVLFYIMIPLFIVNKNLYYILSLIFYIIGIMFFRGQFSNENVLMLYIFKYNIYFSVGVYIYYNYNLVLKYFYIANNVMFFGLLFLLFSLSVMLNYFAISKEVSFLISLLASVVLIVNFLEKKVTNVFLQKLGEMSYTIYITHFASIYLYYLLLLKLGILSNLNRIELWWVWIIGVAFCIIISIPFYYLVEEPTKRILFKLRKINK